MERIIKSIIQGKVDGETVSDILTLCYLAALKTGVVETGGDGVVTILEVNNDAGFKERLKRLGKILCPIADNDKQNKAEYNREMIQVRLQYAGITTSARLQKEFTDKIMTLAQSGQISSLLVAIDNKVWQYLRRSGGTIPQPPVLPTVLD